ncbi:hypothetical protein C6I20_11900 [Aeromicrobium sp. A1-2]|uniref:hypothetical protein n=1 Tax=Aeromicrobium sp. A1-2 TaxID=2107713 RepID=UPI000E4A7A3C|nr:hypothetical protein [Aeromicrobium sp. A1-2]AXT85822.1 hypothetical protein C6I20_11900 [Aeromicrobium sp. A1-2]
MDAEARFDEILDELAPRGVLPGALFGSRSLTYEGGVVASFGRDRLAIKLGADTAAYAEALALTGAQPFDPSGKGRPMKDWVVVPAEHAAEWQRLAEAGLDAMLGGSG